MPEVLVRFDAILSAPDGRRFTPQACGRPAGNVWEGWIEFLPVDGGTPVRTPRETEQPKRDDVVYWAQGLTRVYLDGALSRALQEPIVMEEARSLPSSFDGPAPSIVRPVAVSPSSTRPVLDPFNVAQQVEDILLRELSALDTARIRDIVLAYGFVAPERAALATREQLAAAVVAGVQRPAAGESDPELRPEA